MQLRAPNATLAQLKTLASLSDKLMKLKISMEDCDVLEETLLKLADIKTQPVKCHSDLLENPHLNLEIACPAQDIVSGLNSRFPELKACELTIQDIIPGFPFFRTYGKSGIVKQYIGLNVDHMENQVIPAIVDYLDKHPEVTRQYVAKCAKTDWTEIREGLAALNEQIASLEAKAAAKPQPNSVASSGMSKAPATATVISTSNTSTLGMFGSKQVEQPVDVATKLEVERDGNVKISFSVT